jgi:hypothetical protein
MFSWYITKCKYILKMIQIFAKLNEVFSHVLNMNWLYHSITIEKFDSCNFKKKHLDKFFIEMNINMLKKNILLKNYFHLKEDKNYVGGLWVKIHFICLSKH